MHANACVLNISLQHQSAPRSQTVLRASADRAQALADPTPVRLHAYIRGAHRLVNPNARRPRLGLHGTTLLCTEPIIIFSRVLFLDLYLIIKVRNLIRDYI